MPDQAKTANFNAVARWATGRAERADLVTLIITTAGGDEFYLAMPTADAMRMGGDIIQAGMAGRGGSQRPN